MTIALYSPLPSSTHMQSYPHSHNRSHSPLQAELDHLLLPVASSSSSSRTSIVGAQNGTGNDDRRTSDDDHCIEIYDEKLRHSPEDDSPVKSWRSGHRRGARDPSSHRGRLARASVAISLIAGLFVILLLLALPDLPVPTPSWANSEWLGLLKSSFSEPLSAGPTTCPDPYALPGYLLHDNQARTARWVPFVEPPADVQESGDDDAARAERNTVAQLPAQRNDLDVPSWALEAAPPSYLSLLRARKQLVSANELVQLDDFRNKTVLIVGCSLDRYFLNTFCDEHGGVWKQVGRDWKGTFACDFADLNLQIQLWFQFGALPGETETDRDDGSPRKFEKRVCQHWVPYMQQRGYATSGFDLIIWSSGTWDVLGLRKRAKEANNSSWREQGISWRELAWHRRRLNEMGRFMREQWPDSPIMFRPVSYLYKKGLPSTNHFLKGATTSDIDYINESVYRVGQSIRYLTEHQQEPDRMPIFRWSDKLIGSNQYEDPMHFAWGSYPQWLYGEMMLYYLRYYSMPERSHCRSTVQD